MIKRIRFFPLAALCCIQRPRVSRLAVALMLTGGLALYACGDTTEPLLVTSVVVTPAATTLASLGETVQLTASARDANGNPMAGQTFTWTTSDAGVATVDAPTGLVTAVDNGEAVITATADGISGKAMIAVADPVGVGPNGNTISAADGAVTLVFPAGAVDEAITVTVDAAASLPNPAMRLLPGAAFDFGPEGIQFNAPVALTIAYDPAEVPAGTQESSLRLFRLVDAEWVQVSGSTVNVASQTVTGEINSFSVYGVLLVPTQAGSFQATVSGDLALSFSGSAVFGVQTQQGRQAFVIGFIKGDPGSNDSDIIVISRDNTAIPGPGTYTIVSASCTTCTQNDFASGFLHQVTSLDFGIYFSESGSLTLESVSSELLEGFFSFTATAFLKGGSVTAENLTIEGTFIAVPGDIPSINGPAPTLSGDVQPIFSGVCAVPGCHVGTTPQEALNLSEGLAHSNIVNVSANQLAAMMRVRPGQPDQSYLVHKIQGTQASVGGTGNRMPLGGTPLTQAQIDTIRDWIAAGAPNN